VRWCLENSAPQIARPAVWRAFVKSLGRHKKTMSRYEILSIDEAAAELRRKRWFLYKLLEDRKLAFHVIGGRKMILRSDLDEFIARSRVAAIGEKRPNTRGRPDEHASGGEPTSSPVDKSATAKSGSK
jgi:excisionase family DNA binding protein